MQGVKEKDSGNSYLGWAPDPRESEWGSWRCYCCLTLKATVRMFYRILAIKSHQKLARKPLPPLVSLQWHCRLNWTFCCLAAKKYLQSIVPFSLLLLLLLSCFSRVRLCATPQTAAHQSPPFLGFSRQEYWSGLPFPSPMHESEKWKWSRSVMSDSSRPHGLQPTRLLCPWDFPGKSTGVGCHCLLHSHKLRKKKIQSGEAIHW